jgi:hypothetical protein
MGYTGEITGRHDWATLRRGDLEFDVTRDFPVMKYPNELRTKMLSMWDISQNLGIWKFNTQSENLGSVITYFDIVK